MTPRTILLVEDSPDDVALAGAAFARLGLDHRLTVAADGETALEYLLHDGPGGDQVRPMPDLVLLDLKLPGIDGFEVLRRIRADPRAGILPVLMLTSSIEERDVLAGYRLGANSYIRKPIDFDEFLSVLEQLVRYWLALNQPPPLEMQP
jgi:two-component system, response regulator